MSRQERPLLDSFILGLLATLLVTNSTLLILLRTGGPLIGLAFYLVLLALTIRAGQRDHRLVMGGGLVGLVVHVMEVAVRGWSAYPLLMGLNVVLPAALVLLAWVADRRPQRQASNE